MAELVINDPALFAVLKVLDEARTALTEDTENGRVRAAWILGKLEGELVTMLRPVKVKDK